MLNILVTGSTRGIGAASADLLEENGARIARHGRRPAARTLGVDLSTDGAAETLWEQAVETLGGEIDVLVNNAGVYMPAAIDGEDKAHWDAAWQESLQINLKAPADLCRLAIRHWQARGTGGRIINIASRAAYRGDSIAHGHYAAAKSGLVGLTKTLARGFAGDGILLFGIAPGFVMTGMADDYLASRGGDVLLRDIPLGRVAGPEEVASAVDYLARLAPPSMTGTIIDINGASYVR